MLRARDKVKSLEELKVICDACRSEGRRIVFTNGCFDLLHVGHLRYLEDARSLGDLLVVGVNTDDSIREIKGPLRPINSEWERAELLAALHCVDFVVLFGTPDPLPLIELLQPHVLAKGADWALERIVGAEAVQRAGGEVVRIPLVPDTSTTIIVTRIARRFADSRGE